MERKQTIFSGAFLDLKSVHYSACFDVIISNAQQKLLSKQNPATLDTVLFHIFTPLSVSYLTSSSKFISGLLFRVMKNSSVPVIIIVIIRYAELCVVKVLTVPNQLIQTAAPGEAHSAPLDSFIMLNYYVLNLDSAVRRMSMMVEFKCWCNFHSAQWMLQ